jgi:hypothetical protein
MRQDREAVACVVKCMAGGAGWSGGEVPVGRRGVPSLS